MSLVPHIRILFCCAGLAAILPAGALVQGTAELDAFGRLAAAALDKVGRFDDEVSLDWWRPSRKEGFAFYGSSPGTFISVNCEHAQQFQVIVNANDQAQFNVGACYREATRIRDLAVAAEKANSAVIEGVFKAAKPDERGKVEKMLAYRKVPLARGMTGYTFTLVAVGHGIVFVNQAIVYDPSRRMAFIAQASVGMLCGHFGASGKATVKTAFCPDTSKALLDVAAALATRFEASPK